MSPRDRQPLVPCPRCQATGRAVWPQPGGTREPVTCGLCGGKGKTLPYLAEREQHETLIREDKPCA